MYVVCCIIQLKVSQMTFTVIKVSAFGLDLYFSVNVICSTFNSSINARKIRPENGVIVNIHSWEKRFFRFF